MRNYISRRFSAEEMEEIRKDLFRAKGNAAVVAQLHACKVAAQQRAWYEANRDKVAAQQRAYREANRDKVAEYNRKYYAKRKKVVL